MIVRSVIRTIFRANNLHLLSRIFTGLFELMFKKIRGMFSNDLSIDLGTASTLIYVKDQGIFLN